MEMHENATSSTTSTKNVIVTAMAAGFSAQLADSVEVSYPTRLIITLVGSLVMTLLFHGIYDEIVSSGVADYEKTAS